MPLEKSLRTLALLAPLGLCAYGLTRAAFWSQPGSPIPFGAAESPTPATVSSLASPVAPGDDPDLAGLDLEAPAFELWLDARFPRSTESTQASPLSSAARDGLIATLTGPAGRATRAVLILARSQEPWVGAALLERLEQRVNAAERWADAGDQAAAAALARMRLPAPLVERLYALADGDRPHPDLEVRTECAIAALAQGERRAQGFLLRVLRIDTFSAQREGPVTDSPTTAWPRGRAAEALCRLAGVPFSDWSDQPLVDREAAADRLEALLQGR